ncbi:unnamed protein product [Urochloa humidicola]
MASSSSCHGDAHCLRHTGPIRAEPSGENRNQGLELSRGEKETPRAECSRGRKSRLIYCRATRQTSGRSCRESGVQDSCRKFFSEIGWSLHAVAFSFIISAAISVQWRSTCANLKED